MATKIFLPRLGESIEEATIIRYTKEVGEKLDRGDVIAELETAKAMMELENPVKGVLLAVFPEVGETIPRGTLVAIVGKEGEDWQSMLVEEKEETPEPSKQESAPAVEMDQKQAETTSKRVNISPNAKRIAEKRGVDPQALAEAYPGKRITGEDVEAFLETLSQSSGYQVPAEAVALNTIQAVTARRMAESGRDIPQYAVSMVVKADALLQAQEEKAASGQPITLTALLVQATAEALAELPRLNAYFSGDKVNQYQAINIAIAIHTEQGLVAPVIHQADQLNLQQIAERLSELKVKAAERKLSTEDFEGATFTISNLGMMGVRTFVPMVTPGQAAILGVGEIYPVTSVDESGSVSTYQAITLTLSADHRVIGGAECAAFLNKIKTILEKA